MHWRSVIALTGWGDWAWIAGLMLVIAIGMRYALGAQVFQLRLPIIYDGDALLHAAQIKSVVEQGWFPWRNQFLGAPFGANYLDFPSSDGAFFVLVNVLGAISPSWIFVLNVFYALGFVLIGFVSFLVCRDIGLESPWAFAASVLFTFLPFHFFRLGHLFLSFYVAVPLFAWLALKLDDWGASNVRFSPGQLALLVVVVLTLGSTGVYYAFFGCFFLLLAGAGSAFEVRKVRPAALAALIAIGVSAVVFINTLPTVLYHIDAGPNPEVARRIPSESEIYGLKIAQLVLPRPGHRLSRLAQAVDNYSAQSPLVNENSVASLGLVGGIGFLALLAIGLMRIVPMRFVQERLIDRLTLLNVGAVLLGTIGGFGALFNWYISPMIRAYNRISVFIGFFCIVGLVLLLRAAWDQRRGLARRLNVPLPIICGVLVAIGMWDQTSPAHDRLGTPSSFESDRDFVQAMESALPFRTMVYQLPYHPYPEAGPVQRMADYDLMRGYLHSRALRWSYGGMRGREGDLWFRALSTRPIREQVDTVVANGFGAIYVDRRAYADPGAFTEELQQLLGPPALVSSDGNLVFFRLPIGSGSTAGPTRG